uniref:Pecanex-like protein n=1 Tax=Gongylonema pulchrum TaxID=637853 RepID=A0A183E9D1_9BILA
LNRFLDANSERKISRPENLKVAMTHSCSSDDEVNNMVATYEEDVSSDEELVSSELALQQSSNTTPKSMRKQSSDAFKSQPETPMGKIISACLCTCVVYSDLSQLGNPETRKLNFGNPIFSTAKSFPHACALVLFTLI